MINLADDAMTIKLDYELPEYPKFEEGYRRAPRRESHLTEADKALAIKNALRYIHPDHHEQMAKEFAPPSSRSTAASMATASVPRASSTASPSTNTRASASRARPFRS